MCIVRVLLCDWVECTPAASAPSAKKQWACHVCAITVMSWMEHTKGKWYGEKRLAAVKQKLVASARFHGSSSSCSAAAAANSFALVSV